MHIQIKQILMLCYGFAITGLCFTTKIKLIYQNKRLSGTIDSKSVRSVLECSYLFQNSENSFSFNFKIDEKLCELSGKRPEDGSAVTVAEGWNVYAPIESNYYISSKSLKWQDAKVQCKKMSGTLVMIDDHEEQLILRNIGTELNHWIGMTCDSQNRCKWIDGRKAADGFQAWAPGEPSNDHVSCVMIGYQGDKLDDTDCNNLRKFICEF